MELIPKFIGIGAQKCATTWLYDLLELHPDVGLSSVKEVHFFSQFYAYGFQWYHQHFNQHTQNVECLGEFSTTYFSDLSAPARIKQAYPNCKLILMLRDPVDRLISNHKHEIRIGHFSDNDLSYEAGINNNPTYIEQGFYATHLKRWLTYFDKNQIHIVIFDDVIKNPSLVEKNLYSFLDLEYLENHQRLSKSNSSYVYRFKVIEKTRHVTLSVLRKIHLETLYRKLVKLSGLQGLYRKINRAPAENIVPRMDDATKIRLKKIFLDEIVELENMTSLNLQNWK